MLERWANQRIKKGDVGKFYAVVCTTQAQEWDKTWLTPLRENELEVIEKISSPPGHLFFLEGMEPRYSKGI